MSVASKSVAFMAHREDWSIADEGPVCHESYIAILLFLCQCPHRMMIILSESARARPGSAKSHMHSNCCVIIVIRPPPHDVLCLVA